MPPVVRQGEVGLAVHGLQDAALYAAVGAEEPHVGRSFPLLAHEPVAALLVGQVRVLQVEEHERVRAVEPHPLAGPPDLRDEYLGVRRLELLGVVRPVGKHPLEHLLLLAVDVEHRGLSPEVVPDVNCLAVVKRNRSPIFGDYGSG